LLEDRVESALVANVVLIEYEILVRDLFDSFDNCDLAVAEIVNYHDFETVVEKINYRMAAYVSGAARNQYLHKNISFFPLFAVDFFYFAYLRAIKFISP